MVVRSGSRLERIHKGQPIRPEGTINHEKVMSGTLRVSEETPLLLLKKTTYVTCREEECETTPKPLQERVSLPETGDVTIDGWGGDTMVVLSCRDDIGPPREDLPPEVSKIVCPPRVTS